MLKLASPGGEVINVRTAAAEMRVKRGIDSFLCITVSVKMEHEC